MNLFWPFSDPTKMPSYTDPTTKAMPYLKNIPSTLIPYFQPYIDTGNQAMSQFFNQISQLATPGGAKDIYNQLSSGYEENPGTKATIDTATKQANQVAASTGMFGTPTEQNAVAAQTENISYKNFNDYMTQLLGLYGQGLKGEQGLMSQGFEASTTLAEDLAKNLMSEAGLEYAGAQGKNKYNEAAAMNKSKSEGALFGSLLGLVSSLMRGK